MTLEPVLVLLHSLPLDGSMWADVVTADLGPPVRAPTLYDLGTTVEGWAAAVVDQLDPGPIVLVGASVGASCALEVAALVPERVGHLVLIGGKAGHRPDADQHAAVRRILDTAGMAGAWDRIWAPLMSPAADPAVVDRIRSLVLAQDPVAVGRDVDAFHTRPDRAELARSLAERLTVVRGADDPIVGDVPALVLPHLVTGSGHYVPLERPECTRDLVRTAVSRWRGCA